MKSTSFRLYRRPALVAAIFAFVAGLSPVAFAQTEKDIAPEARSVRGSFVAPIEIESTFKTQLDAGKLEVGTKAMTKGGGAPVVPISGNWLNLSNQETFDLYHNSYGEYVFMYYKEDGGVPTWYISANAYLVGNQLTNVPLYRSRWDYSTNSMKPLQQVGNATVTFSSSTQASFSWSVFGAFGTGNFVLAYGGGNGRTGMYYPGSMSGLGAMLNSYGNYVMANFAYYDGAGNPIWARAVAANAPVMNFALYSGNSNNWVGSFLVYDSGYITYFNASLSVPNFDLYAEPFFLLAY